MSKWTKEQLQKHIRDNLSDYGSMIVISILYKKLYGEYPKIGMSGQQAEFAESVKDKLPDQEGEGDK